MNTLFSKLIPPLPKTKCLRKAMEYAYDMAFAEDAISKHPFCVRFCQKGCLSQAEEHCKQQSKLFCSGNCVEKCFHTGIPTNIKESYKNSFLYPKYISEALKGSVNYKNVQNNISAFLILGKAEDKPPLKIITFHQKP